MIKRRFGFARFPARGRIHKAASAKNVASVSPKQIKPTNRAEITHKIAYKHGGLSHEKTGFTSRLFEKLGVTLKSEFFSLFNNRNPAAVAAWRDRLTDILTGKTIPFGKATRGLPGREGQIGARIEF
jgi:hypothetical protein